MIEDLVVCLTSDGFPILKPGGHERDARLSLIRVVVLQRDGLMRFCDYHHIIVNSNNIVGMHDQNTRVIHTSILVL